MYLCHRQQQSHYIKHKSATTYVPLQPPTAVTLHKTQFSNHLCTLATAHISHIKQNTNQQHLCTLATAETIHITLYSNQQTHMYTCHRPQQSHYTKHKISNHLCTLATTQSSHITQNTNQKTLMHSCHCPQNHITQISKPLCTLATARNGYITQNPNQQILMYPCHRTHLSHYIKHKSAKPYVPLPPPTSVTLHKTQISKTLCTLATGHNSHFTQNTNQQILMYLCHRTHLSHYIKYKSAKAYLPCHRPQHSHYTKHKSGKPYVPLPPSKAGTLHKTQISKTLCTLATSRNIYIT